MKGNKKSCKKRRNNQGFSLVEVLLAVVILGLIAAPILQIFITSAKINNNSRQTMAATDVATTMMEHINSLKVEGGTGYIEEVKKPGLFERYPELSYTAMSSESITSATDKDGFLSFMRGNVTAVDTWILYKEIGDSFGCAMFDVEHNGQKFDVLIWLEPEMNTGDKYYTYDATIEVYSVDVQQVEQSDGSMASVTSHFGTRLVSVESAIANK